MRKVYTLQKCVDIEALRLDYLAGELSTSDIAQQLDCPQDEVLDRIGVTELRRTLAYTQEEIEAMYQRNENFNGKRANFGKLRLFQEIKEDLTDFFQRCNDAKKLEEIKPNQYEKNAVLMLDMNAISTLNKEEMTALTATMNKADRMVISAMDGGVRFSFCVENIWTE